MFMSVGGKIKGLLTLGDHLNSKCVKDIPMCQWLLNKWESYKCAQAWIVKDGMVMAIDDYYSITYIALAFGGLVV